MIAIVDYGVGNLFSLHSSLAAIGAESIVTGDAAAIQQADAVILPGVGAFEDAAAKLRETGLASAVRGRVAFAHARLPGASHPVGRLHHARRQHLAGV